MAIAGDKPETGVRIAIERSRVGNNEPPWSYSGQAVLPNRSHPIEVVVTAEGEVHVTGAPVELLEKVRLLVRTAFKQAKSDGEPPAWRIVRWRTEK